MPTLKKENKGRHVNLGMQNMAMAQQYYQTGIQTSINFWSSVPASDLANPGWSETLPAAPSAAAIQSLYHSFANVQWNASSALPLIYAQEWIDDFWEPWEDYPLARRTSNATPGGGLPSTSPLYQVYRLPYDVSEQTYHTTNYDIEIAQLGGADNTNAKVWWMP